MAYDGTKPADNGVISQGPGEIRENLRALLEDGIVNAGGISGFAVVTSTGTVSGANWVRLANMASGVQASGLLKIAVLSTTGKRADIVAAIGSGESTNGIGGANASIVGHSRSHSTAINTAVRVVISTDGTAHLEIYQTETCTYTNTGIICEGVTLPTPAVGSIALSSSSEMNLQEANTTHGSQLFDDDGAFLCPPGVFSVTVTASAGGGGGGGVGVTSGDTSRRSGGGGGGGESCMKFPLAVIPGITYSIYVGDGGSGGAGLSGSQGGATEIKRGLTGMFSLQGGFGGEVGQYMGISSSGGGGGSLTPDPGKFRGSDGGVGAEGSGGNGGGNTLGPGASGGKSIVDGANPSAVEGGDAYTPGGGGGGASSYNYTVTRRGGNGAPGFVLLEW